MGFIFIIVLSACFFYGIKGIAHYSRPEKPSIGKHTVKPTPTPVRVKHTLTTVVHHVDAVLSIEVIHCVLTAIAVFGLYDSGKGGGH